MPGTIAVSRLCAALLLLAASPVGAPAQAVLGYHNEPSRSGSYIVPALGWVRARGIRLDAGFAPRFAGRLDAQPLYWQPPGGAAARLVVATEENVVAAIDALSGKTLWSRTLGRPVPRTALPCGNIDPVGVTGTPVIDAPSKALFLDAMVSEPSGPHHLIFALSLFDGAPLPGWPVDVGAALAAHGLRFAAPLENERGALAILGGRVFVPYGGHAGDCGDYHGWVVGVALADPRDVVAWRSAAAKGGIWAPGGIASDGKWLYVATGNTLGALSWGDGEAVFRLSPGLARSSRRQDFFAAADWRALDAVDEDLGGSNPLPIDVPGASGVEALLLQLGKDSKAYLLDRADLGGLGGQLLAQTVSTGRIHAAPVAYPAPGGVRVAFEGPGSACPDRRTDDALVVLAIRGGAPPALGTAWCGAFTGRSAPIVTTTDGRSQPIVWILGGEGDNLLHGFRGDTGAVLFAGGDTPLKGLHHFQTLIATRERLYVGADGRLYAFAF